MEDVSLMLHVECTTFFERNPYTFESLNGLATRLGRPETILHPVLEQLVSLSILEKIGEGEHCIYHYVCPLEFGVEA